MTVQECIKKYKEQLINNLTMMWVCPKVVDKIRVGKSYTLECSIASKVDPELAECSVVKCWRESNTLCIVYQPKDAPIVFTS